jgi:hypothetical protein
MARAVVGNPFENQIPTVSPTAQPVDIYQRGVVKSSPFASLAENLSRLSQKADRAFGNVEKRAAEREFAEGQELYNKTRLAIGDAVREGIIDEGESPYLRKGYRVSQLNVLANKYATDLNVALEAQQLYKNGNPAAAEKFSQDFYNKFVEANDLSGFAPTELAEFLTPTTQKANAAFISSWKTKNISWQREQNYIQLQEEIGVYTNSLYDGTPTSEDKKTALSTWIQSKLDGAEANGMDRQKVNKAIVDAVIITALENDDLDRLKVLDTIKAGTGFLGDRVDVRKAMLAAENTIQSAKASKSTAEIKAQEAEWETGRAAAISDGFSASLKIRYANTPLDLQNAKDERIKAINALRLLGEDGDIKALTAAKELENFFFTMDERGKDARLVDESQAADALQAILGASSSSEAMNLAAFYVRQGSITASTAENWVGSVDRRLNAGFTKEDFDTSGHPAKKTLDLLTATAVSKITQSAMNQLGASLNPEDKAAITAPLRERIYYEFSTQYLEWKYQYITNPENKGVALNSQQFSMASRAAAAAIRNELAQSFVDPTIEITLQETLDKIATDRANILAAQQIAEQLAEEAARAAEQAGEEFDNTVPEF